MLGLGQNIVSARRYDYLSLGQFTANTTVVPAPRWGVGVGVPGARVLGIHVACSAIPSDPDGTMLLNVFNNDISEGAEDTLVASADLEALVTVADRWFEMTLAADGAEEIRTLAAGDAVRTSLVNNSAAITTNPNVSICIEWISVPRSQQDEDERPYVLYPSQMSEY